MQQRPYLRDFLILLAIYTVWFLLLLGTRPLNIPDEGRYPSIGWELMASHHWLIPKLNGVPFLDKPILYYWLEALSMKAFGVNAWAIRLPQALFGIAGCLLVYIAGVKLFDRRTGILASIILATSPLYFFAAHYADMDLEVAILISASLLSFIIAQQQERRRGWMVASFVFAGLACLTKGLMGIVFPIYVIGVWVIVNNRWGTLKRMHLLPGIAAFLIITLPWYIAIARAKPWFLHYFFVYQQFDRYLAHSGFNNVMPFWFYLPLLLVGLMPWTILSLPGLGKLRTLCQTRQQHEVLWFLVLWVVLITLFFSIPKAKIVGYILPVVPAIALLTGHWLSQSSRWFARKTHLALIGFSIVISLMAIALLIAPWVSPQTKPALLTFSILGVLLLLGVLALWKVRSYRIPILIAMMACFNLGALIALPTIDTQTSLPLARAVQPYLATHPIIVNYNSYNYDLPLYLQRRITVVYDWHNTDITQLDNWARDFYFGVQHDPATRAWMISPSAFLQEWQHHADSMLVFTPEWNYQQLKTQLHPTPIVIARYQGTVVITTR